MAQIQITPQDLNINGSAVKLIAFVGQLDETNVDQEAQSIYRIIDAMPVPNLILDFAGLEYMNSKSIGYVTDWYSRVMTKNGKINITSPKPNILDILKVVGITQIVTVHNSLEQAKADFGVTAVTAAQSAPTGVTAPPMQQTENKTPAPPVA